MDNDPALMHLTGEQALTILQRAADMMENGLEPWDPTGHNSADSLACTLLGISERACQEAVRVQARDGVEAVAETAWVRGIKAGNDIFAAGRED